MGFRDLQRYEAQKPRYDAYKLWVAKSPAEKAAAFDVINDATKRAVIAREKGYVSPFGTVGSTKIYLPTKILSSTQSGQGGGVATSLRTILANYVSTAAEFAALTTPIEVAAKKFKFAKLTLTAVAVGAKSNSRITGARYNKPEVDSVTCPFGQQTGGQDYDTVISAIKGLSAYTTFLAGNSGKNRARFTPEG